MDISEQWKDKIDDVYNKISLDVIPKLINFSDNLKFALSKNKTDDIPLSYIMDHLNLLVDELNKIKYQKFMA